MKFAPLRKPSCIAFTFALATAILLIVGCAVQNPRAWERQSETEVADTARVQAELPPAAPTAQPGSNEPATAEAPAPMDDDGDGVPDIHDHCQNTPRGATVDAMGCPHDSDGDGVYDGIDRCPNTLPVVGMKIDSTGCPADADRDGVPDHHDLCPNTPEHVDVTPQGCPVDSDEDGVPDYQDKCPGTPSGVTVAQNGCEPDGDGDGVPDPRDLCPNTPKGLDVDETGCLVMTQVNRRLILYVNYVPGTTDPDPMSLRILEDVAIRLENNPGLIAIVEGFTDNIGLDQDNLAVSQKRADKVARYLEKKGIPASRIESHGRGETHFIADNGTAAGRQKNRRIEISFHPANSN